MTKKNQKKYWYIELRRVSKNLSNRKWRKLHKELSITTDNIISEIEAASFETINKKLSEEVSQICEKLRITKPINITFIYKEGEKKIFEKKNILFQELKLEQPEGSDENGTNRLQV